MGRLVTGNLLLSSVVICRSERGRSAAREQ
jgi:hypothetical protein